jgi:NAD-dependent SIR2 family protein deacetylase
VLNVINKDLESAYKIAINLIQNANTILVSAGPGMGVDSGLPDSRGDTGFYKAYPSFSESGLKFHTVATPTFLASDPEKFWWFYAHRHQMYKAKNLISHTKCLLN